MVVAVDPEDVFLQGHGAGLSQAVRHRGPDVDSRHDLSAARYCSATRIGISPVPAGWDRSALPMIAPWTRAGSSAFMACPGVAEVVSRSPATMGEVLASTRQATRPASAT